MACAAGGLRCALALAVLFALACGPAPRAGPPNLVVLLADDLGWGDLGVHGAPDVATPELDRLSASGARFSDAYAASPVCSPTRAALLTGLYPQRLGHHFEDLLRSGASGIDPRRFPTLAERLRRAGYRTACFGKWNVEGRGDVRRWLPNDHGFERWFGALYNHDYFTHRSVRSGKPDLYQDGRPVELEGHTDRLLADHAVRFIEEHADEPFFLYVPWLLVHGPLQAPDDPTIRPIDDRGTHAKMVEYLDLQVGRILAALREAGLERQTLVIFTSDNGGHFSARNAPFSGLKRTLAEGGIRVPLMLRWPGVIPPARSIDAPVVTMDLTATLLTAAGLADEARGLDGIDLLPLATGAGTAAPRALFWRKRSVFPSRGIDAIEARSVREGEWKLLVDAAGERLYRLTDDPGETRDLSHAERSRLERLRGLLSRWERDVEPR